MTVEMKDASLALESKSLFHNLSFVVSGGEMLCVMGESGCGKTTLLRCILGFQPLDEGSVSIGGTELTPLSAEYMRSMMAYVPQEVNLPCNTVAELVALPYQLRVNRDKRFSKEALMDQWVRLRLDETLYDKRMAEVSGGERQRIMLSMAGLLDKKVLLVDEPTSALDVDSALLVAGYLQSLAKRGAAIIAVSHIRDNELTILPALLSLIVIGILFVIVIFTPPLRYMAAIIITPLAFLSVQVETWLRVCLNRPYDP